MALTGAQKFRIIDLNAAYNKPAEVMRVMQEEFPGIKLSKQQVDGYNPDHVNGRNLSAEHIELFHARRKFYRETIEAVPLSSPAYRLRVLQKIVDDPMQQMNARLMLDIVETVEKIEGGLFTNRRELSGPEGGSIPVSMFGSALDKIFGDANGASDDSTSSEPEHPEP